MNIRKGLRLLCLLLCCLLVIGVLPSEAQAVEPAGRFILVAEAGGKLVIAPEYITYAEGQTLGEALQNSGHTFTGLEQGQVTAIDGVTGNYTRSDQNGGYDLSVPASSVTHFCFSERPSSESQPSEGLLLLMTAMADYLEKEEDVRKAAKAEYDTAKQYFVGVSHEDAKMLASDLNKAIQNYESALAGTKYSVSFTDGSKAYSASNYPGVTVVAENSYGKVWTDEGDGTLELTTGEYTFCVEQNGLRVEGPVKVTGNQTVTVELHDDLWLKLDAFRLSGTYGEDNNKEKRFVDGELEVGQWNGRTAKVAVPDMFTGAVYTYAEYDTAKLNKVPTLTAIYTLASTGNQMEKELAFGSKTVGAYEVLAKGAAGNTVIYRVTNEADDGYAYSQDYTVIYERIPTLSAIQVTAQDGTDQDGTDQAPTYAFSGSLTEYTYKVLDTTTTVTVKAQPMDESYSVNVNGKDATAGVTVPVNGETKIEVVVSANGYSNTYTLTIQPGEGKTLSFISNKEITIEVVNSNGVVMPFTTHRETDTQNRYKYTLVPGETYHYVATKDTYYHIADDFKLEDVANSTITVDFANTGDWLNSLSFGNAESGTKKGNIPLATQFSPENHHYQAVMIDKDNLVFTWLTTSASETNLNVEAMYTQVFNGALYHGKSYTVSINSGLTTGTQLKRLLMQENPLENEVTIRLTKQENGVTYYQDYVVEFKRTLTMKDLTAECDGMVAAILQEDGIIGFDPLVNTYDVTVSMAAQELELAFIRYGENTCYGESDVGYRILVDGIDRTEAGTASIMLDGTAETQVVTITVQNEKAPDGSTDYVLNILKSPPVIASIQYDPEGALLNVWESMTGERLWPDADGNYQLCEGYAYNYTLTEYGYVNKAGTLDVTRNEDNELVIMDGDQGYLVTEENGSGVVTILWTMEQAPVNGAINTGIFSPWPNFRGSNSNNAVTNAAIPTSAEGGTLYWANLLGSGIDSDAVGSPILVGGDIITYASNKLFRVDTVTGEILATGTMDHKSSFSITPPTYANGMVFVALSDGCVQAFNASTLESLWIHKDQLGGQPNCPLIVKDGYLYTGFWNSETGDANFVCMTITDEDPTQSKESKCVSWYHTAKGGYYWAGAYVGNGYVLIGTDDGTNLCNSQTSSLLLLDAKTGRLLDRQDNLNGDIRSTIVYDATTDAYYFTSKGGSFYSVQVSGGSSIVNMWSVSLQNGVGGIPMSTCSPVVYNGRAYIGVSGAGQFSAYSGHNITVVDLASRNIAYSVPTQGYPQTSGLLTTAYGDYTYVYFFDNMTPGKLRVLRDKPGMIAGNYFTVENEQTTAYALFTPTGNQAQYAICSPIVDEYGTIYFKNDSAHLMAFGSAIEKIEITTAPNKTSYIAGESFDPTGMVVTATYANGKTRDITRYVSWNEEPLTTEDTAFTISFEHVMYHNQEEGTEMVSGVVTQTPAVTIELTVTEGILGDVDGNGKIEPADARMILDFEAKVLEHGLSLFVADVSGDGIIDSNDAVLIQQYLAGKFDKFPAEEAE